MMHDSIAERRGLDLPRLGIANRKRPIRTKIETSIANRQGDVSQFVLQVRSEIIDLATAAFPSRRQVKRRDQISMIPYLIKEATDAFHQRDAAMPPE
jgi:hypothetical protein